MVNKKIVIIVTILAILVIGSIFGYEVYKFNQKSNSADTVVDTKTLSENNIPTTNTTIESTSTNNETAENTITDNETKETNTIQEENTNTSSNSTETNTPKATDVEKTEEKAISILKEKLGSDNSNVYFYIEEEVEKGIFIISVRDSDTTAEISSYKVDTNKKTATEN